MRLATVLVTTLAVTGTALGSAAADEPEVPAAPSGGGWTGFVDRELDRVMAIDPYGVTGQLPAGYAKFKWDWGRLKAGKRYDAQRKLGPVVAPIELELNGEKQIAVDLGLEGHGGGHTFQFSYGITDPLDWYIEIPVTYLNVAFNPTVETLDDEGNRIGPAAAGLLGIEDRKGYNAGHFVYETLPALGRPTPATEFKGRWMMGDINTGFSWNYYRNSRFSAALTGRVYLPTGHIPPAERDLFYGTGPELEIGVGGWGTGFTQGYDLRLFRYLPYGIDIVASTEFKGTYFFEQQRKYPTNFVKPHPAASELDPESFPDLSELDGTFSYRPGWGLEWSNQLNVTLALFSFGIGYGFNYGQEPEISGDPAFLSMVEGLELLGAQSAEILQIAGAISLIPFYIPAQISANWRTVIDGYNYIVFDDFYTMTLEVFIPLFPLWE